MRSLKEAGIVPEVNSLAREADCPPPLPRILVKRSRAGYAHPAAKEDISAILRFFGEQYIYGLRSIELTQAGSVLRGDRLLLGRLLVPGRIMLYEQALPPWVLPGRLSAREEEKLQRAGAIVELSGSGSQTVVSWPEQTLRDFMLFDVLMHEVAHHLLQQYKGKRSIRIARRKDHEALAERFAHECRLRYSKAQTDL